MKTFDVFLQDRITKVDITIHALTAREELSFCEKLLLFCSMQELKILKRLQVRLPMEMRSKLDALHTRVFALAKSQIMLDVGVGLFGTKAISPKHIGLSIFANLSGIFSSVFASGKTVTNIATAKLSNTWAKKTLRETHAILFLTGTVGEGLSARKAISGNSEIYIVPSAIWAWGSPLRLYTMSKMLLSCEASAGMYRYRLLNELDPMDFAGVDSLTLNDLDYIDLL